MPFVPKKCVPKKLTRLYHWVFSGSKKKLNLNNFFHTVSVKYEHMNKYVNANIGRLEFLQSVFLFNLNSWRVLKSFVSQRLGRFLLFIRFKQKTNFLLPSITRHMISNTLPAAQKSLMRCSLRSLNEGTNFISKDIYW